MKALVRSCIAVLALAPVPAFAQTPAAQAAAPFGVGAIRLACFSPQRAFAESADGKAGQARLTALQNQRAKEIDDRNKALQAQEDALQRNLNVLTEDARNQRTREIERFRVDVQRFIQDAQAELLGIQRDLEAAFVVKLKPAIDQIAKEKAFQLVLNLDDEIVIWADPALDITGDVVKLLARVDAPPK